MRLISTSGARNAVVIIVVLVGVLLLAPVGSPRASGIGQPPASEQEEPVGGGLSRIGSLATLPPGTAAKAGRELAARVPQIVGGKPAEPGYWDSTVAIAIIYPDQSMAQCTGSLFGSRWVLTARHCIDGSSGALVGVGSYDLNAPSLRTVQVDGAWLFTGSTDDIGFLRLAESVTQPGIRLQRTVEAALAAPGVTARIAGWGQTSTNGSLSDVLLEASVPIVDDAKCAGIYGAEFSSADMLCAGDVLGVGPCFGDSGGPLVVQTPDRPLLAGVTSFGPESCANGAPSAYMSVAAYTQRIVNFLETDPVAPVGAPGASAGGASAITQTSAVVHGVVDPHRLATDFRIAYGLGTPSKVTTTRYGATATAANVQVELSGLRPGKLYTYQVVAINAAGETRSATATFRTAPDSRAPVVRALASKGKAGKRVSLKYRVHDDFSTKTRERVRVYRRSKRLATIKRKFSTKKAGVVYKVRWKSKKKYAGRLKFCVESWDTAGNKSAPSCAPLRLRK